MLRKGGFAPTIFPLFQGTRSATLSLVLATLVMVTSSVDEAGHSHARRLHNLVTGLGSVNLGGASTYSGETVIQSGTLALVQFASIANSSRVVANGTLSISGLFPAFTGASIQSLAGSSAVTLGAKHLTITNANDVFSGIISGGASVTVSGGTQAFSGANTYTGGTTISGGTLQLGNGFAGGSIVGNVLNDGTLAFNRSDSVIFGGLITCTGAVNQVGPGATVLTADNTYTGPTMISSGTLQLGNGGTSGSIIGNIVNNSVLNFNRSDAFIVPGDISGSGAVNQIGAGTTVLEGENTVLLLCSFAPSRYPLCIRKPLKNCRRKRRNAYASPFSHSLPAIKCGCDQKLEVSVAEQSPW